MVLRDGPAFNLRASAARGPST